jgi:hypothetical protein
VVAAEWQSDMPFDHSMIMAYLCARNVDSIRRYHDAFSPLSLTRFEAFEAFKLCVAYGRKNLCCIYVFSTKKLSHDVLNIILN